MQIKRDPTVPKIRGLLAPKSSIINKLVKESKKAVERMPTKYNEAKERAALEVLSNTRLAELYREWRETPSAWRIRVLKG